MAATVGGHCIEGLQGINCELGHVYVRVCHHIGLRGEIVSAAVAASRGVGGNDAGRGGSGIGQY